MRKLLLILSMGLIVSVSEISALSGVAVLPEETQNYVVTRGRIGARNGVKATEETVVVYQYDDRLEVIFWEAVGNVTITVMNEFGYPMYNRTVNSDPDTPVVITTSTWASGIYSIYLTDPLGGYLNEFFVK
ncbi:MAG: DUF3244 domain-containing protein [Bacteroidales bacterium]|nr:DUF3244 domain-containing protein [Bacteroidales bacterium]